MTNDVEINEMFNILDGYVLSEIVSGNARGADILGEAWARSKNIPVKIFIPDWVEYGRSAGIIRNREMARYCDFGVIFWDGKSKGTMNIIKTMKSMVKPFDLFVCNGFEIKLSEEFRHE